MFSDIIDIVKKIENKEITSIKTLNKDYLLVPIDSDLSLLERRYLQNALEKYYIEKFQPLIK